MSHQSIVGYVIYNVLAQSIHHQKRFSILYEESDLFSKLNFVLSKITVFDSNSPRIKNKR